MSRRAVGAGPLRGVVEMRQIDDGKVRRIFTRGLQKAPRDPLRRLDPRDRAPELMQRKIAELLAERGIERLRVRVAPHRLGAIGIVLRCGQADEIGGGVLRLQKKPGRRAEVRPRRLQLIPEPRGAVHAVGTNPHFEMVRAAIVEAVGNDAMGGGQRARRERGLHRTGHRGKSRSERHAVATRGE